MDPPTGEVIGRSRRQPLDPDRGHLVLGRAGDGIAMRPGYGVQQDLGLVKGREHLSCLQRGIDVHR